MENISAMALGILIALAICALADWKTFKKLLGRNDDDDDHHDDGEYIPIPVRWK
jgi:hypothetical protein